MERRFPPLEMLKLHLKDAGFKFNADSVMVPLTRTLMAESEYLRHGVRGAFMASYRAGDSSWAEAENMGELESGLQQLQNMIDEETSDTWLQAREALRLQMGQAIFISVQRPGEE